DFLLSRGAAAESLAVARAMTLTAQSLAVDSMNLRALITRATLLSTTPGLRDSLAELRLRRRIVAQCPGDLMQLMFYFSAALRVAADSMARTAVLDEADAARRHYLSLLGIASRLYDEPAIPTLRAEWSSPLRFPVDERVQNPR